MENRREQIVFSADRSRTGGGSYTWANLVQEMVAEPMFGVR
jgi:hypothetical protein